MFRETLRILKTAGLPAFLTLVVSAVVDQDLNNRLEVLLTSDDGGGSALWMLASASFVSGLVFPLIVTTCCLFGLIQARGGGEDGPHFIGRTFQQLAIETLRAWGSTLRWGLLLIIPGFIRIFTLVFVPFVVCLHGPYDRGEADALKTSARYVRRRLFATAGTVALFHLIIPLVLTDLLDPWRSYQRTPGAAALCSLLDLFLAVLATQILFRLFESARKELRDELVLRLESDQIPG